MSFFLSTKNFPFYLLTLVFLCAFVHVHMFVRVVVIRLEQFLTVQLPLCTLQFQRDRFQFSILKNDR